MTTIMSCPARSVSVSLDASRLKTVFPFFLLISRQNCILWTRGCSHHFRRDSAGALVFEASHV